MDILKQIKEKIPNTPIVLHGASTVIPELVETCNKYGADIPGAKGVPDDILHEASISGVYKKSCRSNSSISSYSNDYNFNN